VQQAFAAMASELQHTHGIMLALRLGVHSGPVVVSELGDNGRLDQTAQGFATYLAHRLQAFAQGGAIYVSETVRQQAAGFFRLPTADH
jgi:class 3 adenylate cyclase